MTSLPKWSFSAGEISPSLWGRPDYKAFANGASVMRNCFVNFRGGSLSRPGMMFVGQCAQSGDALPPRLIRFQFSIKQSYLLEFGDQYIRFVSNGAYVTTAAVAITGATKANPIVLSVPGHTFVNGDVVSVSGVAGMIEIDGGDFIVGNAAAGVISLYDTFGSPVSGLSYATYTGGGTAAKIYTIASPYAAVDLPFLKFTQSADVMSLTCVNTDTATEYPPYDLARLASDNWTLTATSFASAISAPSTVAAVTNNVDATGHPTAYSYVVTAVDSVTGNESVASPVFGVTDSVDISLTEGSITLTWSAVTGAAFYNIYKATPAPYGASVPIGSLFGFINICYGTQFVDGNVQPDFAVSPPLHLNPFARGQVISATKTGTGTGYTQPLSTAAVSSATGSGAVLVPVVVAGDVVAIIIQNNGANYKIGDTIIITDAGGDGNAMFTPVIGPQSGTYPGVVSYFQQRRGYAATLNDPDTYFFSQTGAYTNMDAAAPPIASDAIVGTPWAQQVNGIQWMLAMPGGLIVATGLDAWQLSGTSGPGSPIGPDSQNAQPQESNGFSPTVPPLKINYDIVYLQQQGQVVRDLQYNFYANIYAGTDISFASDHLFSNFQIREWAWAKEPYKLIWLVRDDGKFLSLTFLKEQEVIGWARHDTNGLMQSVATASESPVDATYFIVRRYIRGRARWVYYVERMDNRRWDAPEDPWCVDAGLALAQPEPAATLSPSAAVGDGELVAATVVIGGSGYTAPAAVITDPTGSGSGAIVSLTVGAGVITAATIVNPGTGYAAYRIKIVDATGSGATVALTIRQVMTFMASAPVFAAGDVGSVIRLKHGSTSVGAHVAGGIATVLTITSPTLVAADLTTVITGVVPDDPYNLPIPAVAGQWTLTAPVTTIYNLGHLEGMQVAILADGNVLPNQVVSNGRLTLPSAASAITVGLPFVAQVQSMHAEVPSGVTIQGDRKQISSVTVRVQGSRGVSVGANQPVAAALDYQQEVPWSNMQENADRDANQINAGNAIPLFTGDLYVNVDDDWNTADGQASPGMVAVQQLYPLPLGLLCLIPEVDAGDSVGG